MRTAARRLVLLACVAVAVMGASAAWNPGPLQPGVRVQRVQWVYSCLVTPQSECVITATKAPLTWRSEVFPWTVPQGYWLGITGMQMSEKFGNGPRSSMFVLNNVAMVTGLTGANTFAQPIWIPSGVTVTGKFINNHLESQWMNVVVQGVVIETTETNYRLLEAPAPTAQVF